MNKETIKQMLKDHWLFLCIFTLAIILRLIYFGHVDFSETGYVLHAKNLLAGGYDLTQPDFQTHMLRLPLLVLLAGVIKIFGISHYAIASVTIISSLITLLLLYWIGIMIMDKKKAILGAFLFAIFPLNIKYASIFEADIIISMLMGLCYFLHLKAKEEKQYINIGCILGLGFFIKFFIVIIGMLIGIELFFQKKYKSIFIIGAAFLLTVTPFLTYHFFETGDPFYYITRTEYEAVDYDIVHEKDTTFLYWMFNPFIKKPQQSLFNIYWILFILSFYFSIKRNEWRYYSVWLWVFIGYTLLEISSLVPAIQRYLMIIEVPLILAVAHGMFTIKNKKIFFCLILIITLTSFYQLGSPTVLEERRPAPEQKVAGFISQLEPKDIYITHNNQVGYLNYYLEYQYNYSGVFGYRGSTEYSIYDLNFVNNLSEIHDAYVIIDFRLINDGVDILNYYKENNGSILYLRQTQAPDNWRLIKSFTDENSKKPFGGVWIVE